MLQLNFQDRRIPAGHFSELAVGENVSARKIEGVISPFFVHRDGKKINGSRSLTRNGR